MIRLVALACGLLCGAGFVISDLHDPALLQAFLMPQAKWPVSAGIALVLVLIAAGLVIAISRTVDVSLPGGEVEAAPGGTGWRPLTTALFFGLGWGVAGYFPLAALVSAGMFSPGAAIFLASALVGMVLVDVIASGGSLRSGRRGSRG